MNTHDQRIREFAYQIWESEGRPDGQTERHWTMACKLAETHAASAQQQEVAGSTEPAPSVEPITPISPTEPAQPVPVSDPIQPTDPISPSQPSASDAAADQADAEPAKPAKAKRLRTKAADKTPVETASASANESASAPIIAAQAKKPRLRKSKDQENAPV